MDHFDVVDNMLQSLLQPRNYGGPPVAVRHERRRDKRGRRPSQLPLQMGRAVDAEATPSPDHNRFRNELYVCGRVALLHGIVGALLLGIVILVVGLVQLSPGAEAAQHRYFLLGAGGALTGAGIFGAVFRCICLHWLEKGCLTQEQEHAHVTHHKNGCVSIVEGGQQQNKHQEQRPDKKSAERPKLKAQPSVGNVDLIKQPSGDT